MTPAKKIEPAHTAYRAGISRGRYDELREKIGRRNPSRTQQRRLDHLKHESQELAESIGLDIPWPD